MDSKIPLELEELIICSCCHLTFNSTDAIPKLFTCRHYFCLKCINSVLQEGNKVCCIHCWKRTELPGPDLIPANLPTYKAILFLLQNFASLDITAKTQNEQISTQTSLIPSNGNGSNIFSESNSVGVVINNSNNTIIQNANKVRKGENCMIHAMPNTIFCINCNLSICRACAASENHHTHTVKNQMEAKEIISIDISHELQSMQNILNDVQLLVLKQRDFLLKILDSCTTLKTQIETELTNHIPTLEIANMRESLGKAKLYVDMLEQKTPADAFKLYTFLHIEKQRLQSKFHEMFIQCKLDDLIRNYGLLFDFDLIKQALAQLQNSIVNCTIETQPTVGNHNSILLLANYCISLLYSRHVITSNHQQIVNNRSNHNDNVHVNHQHQQNQHQHQQHQHQHQHQHQNQQNQHQHQYEHQYEHLHQHQHQYQKQQGQLVTKQSHTNNSSKKCLLKTYADITNSPKCSDEHTIHSNNAAKTEFTNHMSTCVGVSLVAQKLQNAARSQSSVAFIPEEKKKNFQKKQQHQQKQHQRQKHQHQQQQHAREGEKSSTQNTGNMNMNLKCNPSVHVYPIFYFDIEIDGKSSGRILIEVRNDVAPKMAKNFELLSTGELGFGYKGCQIFHCWENESIISGDFEQNSGRGGRSVFEESYFMPDETKIVAARGSVGMRRSQKRHDKLGLVGSQFRIILREMRGFTAIFANVIEGLKIVEKISQSGDTAGKPQNNIIIVNCGKCK